MKRSSNSATGEANDKSLQLSDKQTLPEPSQEPQQSMQHQPQEQDAQSILCIATRQRNEETVSPSVGGKSSP